MGEEHLPAEGDKPATAEEQWVPTESGRRVTLAPVETEFVKRWELRYENGEVYGTYREWEVAAGMFRDTDGRLYMLHSPFADGTDPLTTDNAVRVANLMFPRLEVRAAEAEHHMLEDLRMAMTLYHERRAKLETLIEKMKHPDKSVQCQEARYAVEWATKVVRGFGVEEAHVDLMWELWKSGLRPREIWNAVQAIQT